ncbi:CPBP family intramembrane metalloprotease [Caldichromatium japonicum]|uniref:CPBP family intramembrane metalloprotease n=1 Tax=Caldichromatium japonicum TaxID=2699430 RepID=A0A6G7VBF1_9GAMM|nr:CPBP family intramembrane glutamic endopeptidase [Caldichromatium japonicum]QIK37178.1 CPBP family intramembrane metalloprotease [Caldichromatium japonicum]
MRASLRFFVYLLICLLIAGLLTPPLLATGWSEIEAHRLMGRLAQVLILIGLWPFLRWQGLAERPALGLDVGWPALWRRLIWGWLGGSLMLGTLVWALLELTVRLPDPDPRDWPSLIGLIAQALTAGLAIGLLEEVFFRGALYAAICRESGVRAAMLWSAGLYAALHFMKPSALPEEGGFGAGAAFWMMAQAVLDLFQWKNLDSGVALLLAGLLLAWVRERSGNIGWCIGLHAGWVFVIQLTRRLTDGNPDAAWGWLAGSYDGVIGWLAALWIGVLILALWSVERTGRISR